MSWDEMVADEVVMCPGSLRTYKNEVPKFDLTSVLASGLASC
jgi:hypothetical protein